MLTPSSEVALTWCSSWETCIFIRRFSSSSSRYLFSFLSLSTSSLRHLT
jgi:hypothetical protein